MLPTGLIRSFSFAYMQKHMKRVFSLRETMKVEFLSPKFPVALNFRNNGNTNHFFHTYFLISQKIPISADFMRGPNCGFFGSLGTFSSNLIQSSLFGDLKVDHQITFWICLKVNPKVGFEWIISIPKIANLVPLETSDLMIQPSLLLEYRNSFFLI